MLNGCKTYLLSLPNLISCDNNLKSIIAEFDFKEKYKFKKSDITYVINVFFVYFSTSMSPCNVNHIFSFSNTLTSWTHPYKPSSLVSLMHSRLEKVLKTLHLIV